MNTIKYSIRLVSDAMLSSGMGTELIDSLVTRGLDGQPILKGSHIKGIMRQTISDAVSLLGYPNLTIVRNVYGSFVEDPVSTSGIISVSDCSVIDKREKVKTITVTKTKVGKSGVADNGSLRSTEMIPGGTVFGGQCRIRAAVNSPEDLAVRFSLLALDAVGGSRSRGSGQCIVEIEDENRTVGEILVKLESMLRDGIDKREYTVKHRL